MVAINSFKGAYEDYNYSFTGEIRGDQMVIHDVKWITKLLFHPRDLRGGTSFATTDDSKIIRALEIIRVKRLIFNAVL